MVNIEIDGYYCKKCEEWHPELFWHEKYNDYEMNREERYRKAIKRFLKDGELEPPFEDTLAIRGLEECSESGECIICKYNTFFKSLRTGNFVCSKKCKFKDNEINKRISD